MAKFLFIYRQSTERRAHASPEDMQALQAAWYAWMQKFGSAIVVGDGLKPSGRLVKAGIVTDGPYAEAKDLVAGFIVVEAKDLAQAAELAAGCPILEGDGAVEVRPVLKGAM